MEVVNLRNCLRLNLRAALISLQAHVTACMIAIKIPFPLLCMHALHIRAPYIQDKIATIMHNCLWSEHSYQGALNLRLGL